MAAVEGEEPLDGRTEAWMAVSGYRAAMSYILQLADDPFYSHNEVTFRSLHYIMLGYDISKHPGRWRPGGIYVRREPTNEIVYEGPDVKLVPGLMSELISAMNAKSPVPVMVRAAMAHLTLVMIHPFSDGNGRMGRAIQTLVLAREGIEIYDFLRLKNILDTIRQSITPFSVKLAKDHGIRGIMRFLGLDFVLLHTTAKPKRCCVV